MEFALDTPASVRSLADSYLEFLGVDRSALLSPVGDLPTSFSRDDVKRLLREFLAGFIGMEVGTP